MLVTWEPQLPASSRASSRQPTPAKEPLQGPKQPWQIQSRHRCWVAHSSSSSRSKGSSRRRQAQQVQQALAGEVS